jgi:hypothetical protein
MPIKVESTGTGTAGTLAHALLKSKTNFRKNTVYFNIIVISFVQQREVQYRYRYANKIYTVLDFMTLQKNYNAEQDPYRYRYIRFNYQSEKQHKMRNAPVPVRKDFRNKTEYCTVPVPVRE